MLAAKRSSFAASSLSSFAIGARSNAWTTSIFISLVCCSYLRAGRPRARGFFRIAQERLGAIDGGQSIVKLVEAGARSSACEKSLCIAGLIAHQLLGELFRPLVVGNAADDHRAQQARFGEPRARFDRGQSICAQRLSKAIVPSVSGRSAIMTRQPPDDSAPG